MTCNVCGDEVAYCGGCRLDSLKAMTMPEQVVYPESAIQDAMKKYTDMAIEIDNSAVKMGVSAADLTDSINKVAQAMSFTQPRSGNSSHLSLGGTGYRPPHKDRGRHPSEDIHEGAVDRVTRSAMASGLSEEEVLAIVREVYATASVEDQDEVWVERELRNRLKAKVREQFVGYDEGEDLATMTADQFMRRVGPPKDLYVSWDDVASRAARSFSDFMAAIERIREVGYGPVVDVYSEGAGDGCLQDHDHAEAVIHCAVAGVDIRFRVRPDLAKKMQRAASKQKLRGMLGTEKQQERQERFLEEMLNMRKKS